MKAKKLAEAVKAYTIAKAAEAEAKAAVEAAKAAAIAALEGTAEIVVSVDGTMLKVSNTPVMSSRVDVGILRKNFPDAAKACTVSTASSRFTVRTPN